MIPLVGQAVAQVLAGQGLDRATATSILGFSKPWEILSLVAGAARVTEAFHESGSHLCAIVNAKSGGCPEDCRFCGQSARHDTTVSRYPFLDVEHIVEAAKQAEGHGADRFCIVTATARPTEALLNQAVVAAQRISQETRLGVDCSLGFLTLPQAQRLAHAGVGIYNHNLETAASYFPHLVTTHRYEDRVETVRAVKAAGMLACCGGILGVGETAQERLDLAFALRDLKADIVPINILNARPGTPLAQAQPLEPLEIVQTIALFRLILPRAVIKLAGGRERHLRDLQALAVLAGAHGAIVGGYLTTSGRKPGLDLQMMADVGCSVVPELGH